MIKASIIIPVFNHAALTERCLQALSRGDHEVIVVDDASSDRTPRLLQSFGAHLKTVRHSSNQGFSVSCNDGAAAAVGEYLIFLNNDTVPQASWLDALVAYADAHPMAAVVGAKLLYPDNTVQHAGVVICQDHYPRHIYTGFPAEHPAVNKPRQFQIVTAACMLVRRAIFAEFGGFDTGFRNGFEDVDLCLRLRSMGKEVHYCPEAVVQHLESVSPGRFKSDQFNVALYRERWMRRVKPDDVDYYLEDGLLQLVYEGSFPLMLTVSPRLAVIDDAARCSQVDKLLEENARQIADLRREHARLALQASSPSPCSEASRYDRVRNRLRELVQQNTPAGAKVLVVSKGDRALLDIAERDAKHFPQTSRGAYAGHHPTDSFSAIAHLEALRAMGAQYLVFPSTSFWWLEHYREFERHLKNQYRVAVHEPECCLIFELRHSPQPNLETPGELHSDRRQLANPPSWEAAATRTSTPAIQQQT